MWSPQDAGSGVTLTAYSPPNLVHSTSAAFMNISTLFFFSGNRGNNDNNNFAVLLLLLPLPLVGLLPSMRPKYLGEPDKVEAENSRIMIPPTDHLEDDFSWSSEMLLRTMKSLFMAVGIPVGGDADRQLEGLLKPPCDENKVITAGPKEGKGSRHFQEVRETGMYI